MPQQESTIGKSEKVSVGSASPSSDQVVTWKDFQVIKDNVASFKVLLESGVNNLAARQVMRNQAVPPTIAAPASQLQLLPLPRPCHSSPVMCSSLGRLPQFRGLCPGMP